MRRLKALLLAAFMLGPQVGGLVLAIEDRCQAAQGCCEQENRPDVESVQCACCVSRPPILTTIVLPAPGECPPERPLLAAIVAPPTPPPSDILHVPKSS